MAAVFSACTPSSMRRKPVPALGPRLDQGADQLIADAAAMVIGMHREREAGDVALTHRRRAIEHRKATEAPAIEAPIMSERDESSSWMRARHVSTPSRGVPPRPARHAGNAGDRVDRGCVTELQRAQANGISRSGQRA
jgi:hypothetical protein